MGKKVKKNLSDLSDLYLDGVFDGEGKERCRGRRFGGIGDVSLGDGREIFEMMGN